MTTLTVLTWLAAFLLLLFFVSLLRDAGFFDDDDEGKRSGYVVACVLIASFFIGGAIQSDLSGYGLDEVLINMDVRFWLLSGIAAVGLSAGGATLLRLSSAVAPRPSATRLRFSARLVIEIIGLIASILGIIAFYLDFIR